MLLSWDGAHVPFDILLQTSVVSLHDVKIITTKSAFLIFIRDNLTTQRVKICYFYMVLLIELS